MKLYRNAIIILIFCIPALNCAEPTLEKPTQPSGCLKTLLSRFVYTDSDGNPTVKQWHTSMLAGSATVASWGVALISSYTIYKKTTNQKVSWSEFKNDFKVYLSVFRALGTLWTDESREILRAHPQMAAFIVALPIVMAGSFFVLRNTIEKKALALHYQSQESPAPNTNPEPIPKANQEPTPEEPEVEVPEIDPLQQQMLFYIAAETAAELAKSETYETTGNPPNKLRLKSLALLKEKIEKEDYLYQDGEQRTLLHEAANRNLPELIEPLVQKGVVVDAKGFCSTPLGEASLSKFRACTTSNKLACIEKLLALGADPNYQQYLHAVILNGVTNPEVITSLRRGGADTSSTNPGIGTPLDMIQLLYKRKNKSIGLALQRALTEPLD